MGAAGQRRPFGPAGECAPLDRGGCLPVARDGGGGGLPLPPAADGRNNSARRSSRKHGRKAGLSVHNPRWSERKFRCLCARVERSCVECGLFEISLCFTWRPPLDVNSSFQLNSYTSGNPILVLAMALAGPMCEGPQKPRKQSTGKQSTGNHNISPGVKPPVLPLRWHRPVELSPAAGLRRRHTTTGGIAAVLQRCGSLARGAARIKSQDVGTTSAHLASMSRGVFWHYMTGNMAVHDIPPTHTNMQS